MAKVRFVILSERHSRIIARLQVDRRRTSRLPLSVLLPITRNVISTKLLALFESSAAEQSLTPIIFPTQSRRAFCGCFWFYLTFHNDVSAPTSHIRPSPVQNPEPAPPEHPRPALKPSPVPQLARRNFTARCRGSESTAVVFSTTHHQPPVPAVRRRLISSAPPSHQPPPCCETTWLVSTRFSRCMIFTFGTESESHLRRIEIGHSPLWAKPLSADLNARFSALPCANCHHDQGTNRMRHHRDRHH